jgi:hypothetical protein
MFLKLQNERNNVWAFDLVWLLKCWLTGLSSPPSPWKERPWMKREGNRSRWRQEREEANSQNDICNKFIPKPSAMQLLISLYLSLLWHPLSRSSHHQWCWLCLQRRKAGYQKQASGTVLSDDSQSLSLSLSLTRRDGGIPIAQCTNKQIFFFLVVLLLGFFFFCLASAWLCVCLSAFPWLGFHSLIFRLGALQTQATVAYSQYVPLYNLRHSVFALRVRDDGSGGGGKESIASLAGGKLEIQLTMHLSLSLSLCCVDLMWARQLRWDDVVMCSSFWIITALVSKETSFFFVFFVFLVLQSVSLLFSMVFCILLPPPVTSENLTRGFFSCH